MYHNIWCIPPRLKKRRSSALIKKSLLVFMIFNFLGAGIKIMSSLRETWPDII